jgi:hypothetical protein
MTMTTAMTILKPPHQPSWNGCISGKRRMIMDDKVRVDFSYYRDASGQLHERRRVEGETIYDEPVLYWHGQKPWIEISLDAWPWEDKNV